MRRRDYTKHLVVRCTAQERARWKALAELEDQKRNADRRWSYRREEGLSVLIRELLEARAKTHPAAALTAREADMAKREQAYHADVARERIRLEASTNTGRGRGARTNSGAARRRAAVR